MRVWFISKYASIPKYGAASRLFHLANEFNSCGQEAILITSDANHLCDFPSSRKIYNYEKVENTPVYWIKTKKYTRTASISRVLSWIDFDAKLFFMKKSMLPTPEVVIVSSLSLLTIIYGYYLKRRYKATLVFEVRDIWPLTMIEEGGYSRRHPLVMFLRIVEKFGYRHSDLIVGTMPRLDLHVRESIGYERPFFCSPIGYDRETCSKNNDIHGPNLDQYFPEKKIIVGYAGSMGVSNALEPLVECIKRMEQYKNIHFVLTGGGDLRENFEQDLEMNKNVTFVPRIRACDVPQFLSRCDILYLSTKKSGVWRFGQSMNKVVEYMMSGRPIIASYSGFPSMINESGAGVFVPSNDSQAIQEAILRYASFSPAERLEIGAKGRKWILKNRSYSRLAGDYIERLVKINHQK